jgi:serine protease Do
VQQGQGSGFVISKDGYILTNNHVVADASKVKVKLSDDTELDAKVIGTDPRTDVAVVKIDTKKDLPFVKLGSSDRLRVGDWVVAIGNPFGLSHTVTAGIVSAKGRVIGAGPYDDFIQTDASINPGNSGGPLFNLAGEVVGINSAIVNRANSIGFAIPIDMVTDILSELESTGHVARGWMGMSLQELDGDLAKALKVPDDTKGAVVAQVYPGFPAADAGLQPSDVIVELDDRSVASSEELVRSIGTHHPGESVKVTVLRAGKEKTLSVKLGERPDEEELAKGNLTGSDKDDASDDKGDKTHGGSPLQRAGITLEDASRYQMGKQGGLVVTRVRDDSPADGKLAAGDIVLQINQQPVSTVEDANKALAEAGDVALFAIEREKNQRLVAVPLK